MSNLLYDIEAPLEDAFVSVLGATVISAPVLKMIDGDELEQSHVLVQCTNLNRAGDLNFLVDAVVEVLVATHAEETLPSGYSDIRALHRARVLAVRDALWQDNLGAQLEATSTPAILKVEDPVELGEATNEYSGRHCLTRHRFVCRYVCGVDS